jgi:hypothetical protein
MLLSARAPNAVGLVIGRRRDEPSVGRPADAFDGSVTSATNARSLIPGTGSSPKRTPSASSTLEQRDRAAVFRIAMFALEEFGTWRSVYADRVAHTRMPSSAGVKLCFWLFDDKSVAGVRLCTKKRVLTVARPKPRILLFPQWPSWRL